MIQISYRQSPVGYLIPEMETDSTNCTLWITRFRRGYDLCQDILRNECVNE
jgi:hypothetical protein